ncbi:hypothetical protein RB213_011167, partial [Colletotrichum asianum]
MNVRTPSPMYAACFANTVCSFSWHQSEAPIMLPPVCGGHRVLITLVAVNRLVDILLIALLLLLQSVLRLLAAAFTLVLVLVF